MNVYTKKQNLFWKKILTRSVILLLVLMFLNIFNAEVKNSFYFLFSPLMSSLERSGNGIIIFFKSLANSQYSESQIDNLREENQRLLSKISLLQTALGENRDLGEALYNTRGDKMEVILSSVIGLDFSNGFILVDKGLDDGLVENMPVISSNKVLYGRVIRVYKNFSQVMLLSNKNSVFNARIQSYDPSRSAVQGVVKGNGTSFLQLDSVDPEAEINDGDIVITSGLEGVFPKDLLVGTIISKNKDDQKPFQTAQIQPFFGKDTENLFIITNYKK